MFNDPELLKRILNNNQYYNSNTPKHLLELGRDCPIVSREVDSNVSNFELSAQTGKCLEP